MLPGTARGQGCLRPPQWTGLSRREQPSHKASLRGIEAAGYKPETRRRASLRRERAGHPTPLPAPPAAAPSSPHRPQPQRGADCTELPPQGPAGNAPHGDTCCLCRPVGAVTADLSETSKTPPPSPRRAPPFTPLPSGLRNRHRDGWSGLRAGRDGLSLKVPRLQTLQKRMTGAEAAEHDSVAAPAGGGRLALPGAHAGPLPRRCRCGWPGQRNPSLGLAEEIGAGGPAASSWGRGADGSGKCP